MAIARNKNTGQKMLKLKDETFNKQLGNFMVRLLLSVLQLLLPTVRPDYNPNPAL